MLASFIVTTVKAIRILRMKKDGNERSVDRGEQEGLKYDDNPQEAEEIEEDSCSLCFG